MKIEAVLNPSFYLWPFKMRVFVCKHGWGKSVYLYNTAVFLNQTEQERSFALYKNVWSSYESILQALKQLQRKTHNNRAVIWLVSWAPRHHIIGSSNHFNMSKTRCSFCFFSSRIMYIDNHYVFVLKINNT